MSFAPMPPPPAPPAPPAPARRPRRTRAIRIVSVLSMLVGLASTGVGAVGALGSNSPAPQASPAVSAAPVASPPVSTPPPSPTPPPVVAPVTCSNDVFGYTVRLPSGWFAPSVVPDQACTVFDPQPISRPALLRGSRSRDLLPTAIRIYPYSGSRTFSNAVVDIHNHDGLHILQTIDMAAGNTSAERIVARVRPKGGAPTRLFLYVFDVRGTAFVADAYEPYSSDFGETMRVLDAMMRSLQVE